MENKTRIDFGKLGSVTITIAAEEPLDVFAKNTVSQSVLCSNGTYNNQGGPNFSDDAVNCAVTFIQAQ
jgi:hypothetical protein